MLNRNNYIYVRFSVSTKIRFILLLADPIKAEQLFYSNLVGFKGSFLVPRMSVRTNR